jgi:biotin transport system substrate-specific component
LYSTTVSRIEALKWQAFHWRKNSSLSAKLFLSLGGAMVIGLSSLLKVYLPWTPVPLTGQTFSVLLMGLLLGADTGAAATMIYLLLGGMGLPWFTQAGGWSVFAGPTGGYLIGFVFASFMVGYFTDRFNSARRMPGLLFLMAAANLVFIHGLGMVGLSLATGIKSPLALFAMGSLPFIAGDLIKIVAAVAAARILAPRDNF